jgi:hypothetical protein
MAIRRVGVGHCQAPAEGARGLQTHASRGGKVFEVDRGVPITNLISEQIVSFFTDIIHRFGVPNSIITDNSSQFTGKKFLEFCDNHHIHVDWAAIAHPQSNG